MQRHLEHCRAGVADGVAAAARSSGASCASAAHGARGWRARLNGRPAYRQLGLALWNMQTRTQTASGPEARRGPPPAAALRATGIRPPRQRWLSPAPVGIPRTCSTRAAARWRGRRYGFCGQTGTSVDYERQPCASDRLCAVTFWPCAAPRRRQATLSVGSWSYSGCAFGGRCQAGDLVSVWLSGTHQLCTTLRRKPLPLPFQDPT